MIIKNRKEYFFMLSFCIVTMFILAQGKCRKEKDYTDVPIQIVFADFLQRNAKNLDHPVRIFEFPQNNNIAGGGQFGGNSVGIISDGNGSPIPSNKQCQMTTICKNLFSGTWYGWIKVEDSNNKILYQKNLGDIEAKNLNGASVLVKVPTDGEACTVTVMLTEPCYNKINNSGFIANNFGGGICIPYHGWCRETFSGSGAISKSTSAGSTLELITSQNFGDGCPTCQ